MPHILRSHPCSITFAYLQDYTMLSFLGLKSFGLGEQHEDAVGISIDLGTVELRFERRRDAEVYATVGVSVRWKQPERWWSFLVTQKEKGGKDDKQFWIETGSGPLGKYWPIVELIARGALRVQRLPPLATTA